MSDNPALDFTIHRYLRNRGGQVVCLPRHKPSANPFYSSEDFQPSMQIRCRAESKLLSGGPTDDALAREIEWTAHKLLHWMDQDHALYLP